jgi:hypothetical protein
VYKAPTRVPAVIDVMLVNPPTVIGKGLVDVCETVLPPTLIDADPPPYKFPTRTDPAGTEKDVVEIAAEEYVKDDLTLETETVPEQLALTDPLTDTALLTLNPAGKLLTPIDPDTACVAGKFPTFTEPDTA